VGNIEESSGRRQQKTEEIEVKAAEAREPQAEEIEEKEAETEEPKALEAEAPAVTAGVAEPDESNEQLMAEALGFYDLGVAGDKEAVVKAHELLTRLRRKYPQDSLVESYFGSSLCLLGRDVIDPNARLANTLEGLKIMDRVVKESPENIQVRFTRGYICNNLPETYFHRTGTAIEDFNYLVSRYEQNDSIFSPEYYWQLLYDLGNAYKGLGRREDAVATWSKLARVTTDPKYRELLKHEGIRMPRSPRVRTSSRKARRPSPSAPETYPAHTGSTKPWAFSPPVSGTKPARVSSRKVRQRSSSGPERYPGQSGSRKPWEYTPWVPEAKQAPAGSRGSRQLTAKNKNKNKKKLIKKGAKLHARALTGNKRATRKAFGFFRKAYKAHPEDRLINAYFADCLSMMGRDASDPATMFGNAMTATVLLDDAVNSCPDNIQIRLIRAYQSFRLPEPFFHRTATSIEDFEYLMKRCEHDNTIIPQGTYLQILHDLETAKNRLGMGNESQETGDTDNTVARLISQGSKKDLLEEGIRLHNLGVAGSRNAVKKCHEILEKVHEIDPNDPEALAYFGSSIALLGRDATETSDMFANVATALKMLGQAIGRDGSNPRIRILRAYLAYSLPESFFHLTKVAIEDFLLARAAWEKDTMIFPRETYWQILYDLGSAYLRIGDKKKARKVWSKLRSATKDPKYRALVKNRT